MQLPMEPVGAPCKAGKAREHRGQPVSDGHAQQVESWLAGRASYDLVTFYIN